MKLVRSLICLLICSTPLLATEETDKATVYLFVSVDCPIANAYAPEFTRLEKEFSPQGILFSLVYPDPTTTVEDIAAHREDYAISIEGRRDPDHHLVKLAKATITPEVAVFDSNDHMIYRGLLDNLFNDYGDKRRVATEHYLRDVLTALTEGKKPSVENTTAVGCFIELLE